MLGSKSWKRDWQKIVERAASRPLPMILHVPHAVRAVRAESVKAGQAGHPGHTLSMVEQPEEEVRHRPEVCSQCGEDLSRVPGTLAERRQVLDVPEIRLQAQEHQVEAISCPSCE